MDIQVVESILRSFGINVQSLGEKARLNEDLGMDSQEVVELCSAIESATGVTIPDRMIDRSATVGDVLALVGDAGRPSPLVGLFEGMDGAFAEAHELRAEIACSASAAYDALWGVASWPRLLPHVQAIEVLYDDGRFQEFIMEAHSERGLLRVRSVRQGDPAEGIRYFQPEPPPFLQHHAGGWVFRALGADRCQVTALHRWTLAPGGDQAEEAARVRALLAEHARLALETWKRVLEGGAP
jgi:acyl carrier protein